MVKRLWTWAMVQAEAMADTGLMAGLLAAPLLGVVTAEDADSAVVIDMARNILGNPYEPFDADDGANPVENDGTSGDAPVETTAAGSASGAFGAPTPDGDLPGPGAPDRDDDPAGPDRDLP